MRGTKEGQSASSSTDGSTQRAHQFRVLNLTRFASLAMADENKDQQEQLESGLKGPIHTDAEIKHGDKALALIGDERVELTAEDVSDVKGQAYIQSVRIKRKTDVHILSMLMWV